MFKCSLHDHNKILHIPCHDSSITFALSWAYMSSVVAWLPFLSLQSTLSLHNEAGTKWLIPDSKVHGANMGPIWGRQDPGGPHVVPMNFAIWVLCGTHLDFIYLNEKFKRNLFLSVQSSVNQHWYREWHGAEQWPLLLTWFNLSSSRDKLSYPIWCVRWNYLSIPWCVTVEVWKWISIFVP